MIGESGIEEELESEGVRYFGGTDPEERKVMQEEDYTNFAPDPEVREVLQIIIVEDADCRRGEGWCSFVWPR